MKLTDRIKEMFTRNKRTEEQLYDEILEELENKEQESETIIDEENMYAYYLKEDKKYILVKDTQFPYRLSEQGTKWIEMNKHNFDYYGEFYNFSVLFKKVQELKEKEIVKNKTEDDYLKDYLEHCCKDYDKIIRRMKWFKIDSEQYNNLIEKIKIEIKWELKNTLDNFIDMNKDLTTTRSYEELMGNLQKPEEFEKKFPLYRKTKFDDKISHCGYPNYMWQAGVEGTYIVLKKIPYSNNSLFIHNEYIGGDSNEEYITKMMIVSEKEREIVLDYWDKIQDENEMQFESDYMSSALRNSTEQEEIENEEESKSYNYMMLDRLKTDCDYFLGNGNGCLKDLYYKDIDRHIEEMKKIYNSFLEEEKPEWLSMENIDNYKEKMEELLEENEEEM